MYVVVNGELADAGSPWTNTWTLFCEDASDSNALQNIGSYIVPAFVENYYGPLLNFLSVYTAITSVSLREYGDLDSGYDWTGLAVIGAAGGPPYPAFVTINFELVRNNYAFKSGRKGIAGLTPTYTANNGRMTNGARAALSEAVEGWSTDWTMEAGAADYTFVPRIIHNPSAIEVVPTSYSPVSSVACRGFGSQNTRK